jgi:hypothetical protein
MRRIKSQMSGKERQPPFLSFPLSLGHLHEARRRITTYFSLFGTKAKSNQRSATSASQLIVLQNSR